MAMGLGLSAEEQVAMGEVFERELGLVEAELQKLEGQLLQQH